MAGVLSPTPQHTTGEPLSHETPANASPGELTVVPASCKGLVIMYILSIVTELY